MDRVKLLAKYLLKSELIKSASILAVGTIIAQGIPILIQPFLRRYYTPEDFGVYSLYISLIGILIVVSSLRYEQTIVIPKQQFDASNLLSLSIVISFIFNILIFTIVLVFKNNLVSFFNIKPSMGFILYLIPFGTFLFSVFQAFNFWLIREKAFISISINKVSRRFVEGGFQSTFALTRFSKGLVLGDLLGQIANIIASYIQSIKCGFSFTHFKLKKAKILAVRYQDFPKYSMIPSTMSAASYLLPVVFINRFFSAEYAGYYDLAKLMLSIPLVFIAAPFQSVILQKVSERFKSNQSILNDLKPILAITLVVAIFEIVIVMLFGSEVFVIFFGENWVYSGEISKFLVWSFALNFLISTFTNIFIALNKIKIYSAWQLIYFTSVISLVFIKFNDFSVFIKLLVGIEVVCYLILSFLVLRIIFSYEEHLREK